MSTDDTQPSPLAQARFGAELLCRTPPSHGSSLTTSSAAVPVQIASRGGSAQLESSSFGSTGGTLRLNCDHVSPYVDEEALPSMMPPPPPHHAMAQGGGVNSMIGKLEDQPVTAASHNNKTSIQLPASTFTHTPPPNPFPIGGGTICPRAEAVPTTTHHHHQTQDDPINHTTSTTTTNNNNNNDINKQSYLLTPVPAKGYCSPSPGSLPVYSGATIKLLSSAATAMSCPSTPVTEDITLPLMAPASLSPKHTMTHNLSKLDSSMETPPSKSFHQNSGVARSQHVPRLSPSGSRSDSHGLWPSPEGMKGAAAPFSAATSSTSPPTSGTASSEGHHPVAFSHSSANSRMLTRPQPHSLRNSRDTIEE